MMCEVGIEELLMNVITEELEKPAVAIDAEWERHPHEVHHARRSGKKMLLLDVRHEVEWELANIDGAILIPLPVLPERLKELEPWRTEPVVVFCRSGVRSLQATALLRKAGFNTVHSLAGGIELWAELVDPSIRWW
jgi:adenylyltransferase/sulfurtransferase